MPVDTPSGIKVSCQNERSQHANKVSAYRILQARVDALEATQAKQAQDAERAIADTSSGLRSERIRLVLQQRKALSQRQRSPKRVLGLNGLP